MLRKEYILILLFLLVLVVLYICGAPYVKFLLAIPVAFLIYKAIRWYFDYGTNEAAEDEST